MTDAIKAAQAGLADFCVLFGDRSMYAANGFVSASNMLRFVVLVRARTHFIKTDTYGGLMVLPIGDKVWPTDGTVDLLGHIF